VAFENYVYAVWLDEDEGGNGTILFKASNNGGDTFGNAIPIALNANDSEITFPKVAAYDDNVYIAWNLAANNNNQEAEMMTDLLYVKSSDRGNTFSPPIKLNNNNQEKVGEAQITAYKNAGIHEQKNMAIQPYFVRILWPCSLSFCVGLLCSLLKSLFPPVPI